MDLAFSAEDVAFRDEVRTWLSENTPKARRPRLGPEVREFDMAWQRTMYDAGWGGVAWPVEYGGRDLPLTQQLIWYEEYARTGMRPIDTRFVGLAHAGPTLMARATEEQRAYHLPRILRGEVVWCQGFSEPEAGSDLASLRTRAVVDGDELVVTGQKIWTSFANVADWQELLVRTNPNVPKHKGLTWVICDMQSPGIDVRPIRTIEGGADFNEVFYDEVRIPIANVVGGLDNGWSVAMSTLSFERGTAFTISQVQLASSVERLIELARGRRSINGTPVIADGAVAAQLATARADCAALRALTYLGISKNAHSAEPGPEGSMLKLQYADLGQRLYRLGMEILGPRSLAMPEDEAETDWIDKHLLSYSMSIGGGTSEIQRNIIAERVLGLPGEIASALMDLLPTPEQHEIIDSSRSFLAGRMTVGRARELFEAGSVPAVDDAAWAAAAELGWFALGLPEERGGIGAGLADEALLFREIGRANAPGPFVASVLAARVAAFAGSGGLADEIVGGRRVGLVVPGAADVVDADGALRGELQLVDATDGLALVATPDVAAIVDVSSLADVRDVPCIDPTALLQRADAVGVTPLAAVAADVDPIERRGHVLVAALLAGIADWSRDTASRHAIDRIQFDKPIGVNQAIKHPCANVAVHAQLAFAQSLFAALAIDEARADAELQALSARIAAAAAAELGTATTLQVLGGMGFTHEHDVHLYIKRAALLAHAFGESATWLARVLELPEAV